MNFEFIISLLCFITCAFSAVSSAGGDGPVSVVLDTDLAGDCDDVGAVALLHWLADRGEANILAMGTSDRFEYSILALDALNTYYQRPDIPIGAVQSEDAYRAQSRYAKTIAEEYNRTRKKWRDARDAPDVVDIYRRVLADEPDIDEKNPGAVMISIGFMTNFRDLLQSKGCNYSDLSGYELVERKVRLWVCMGGHFRELHQRPFGREYNVARHPEASRYAFDNWPTPIVFSGYEIGRDIVTGTDLKPLSEKHIVRRAYELHGALEGRHSWDQAAVLYAVRGIDGGPASDYWKLSARGTLNVDAEGRNTWHDDPRGRHRYKIKQRCPRLIADEIERKMTCRPGQPH